MKIFELRWISQDEKEWVAANTNIEALKVYFAITDTDLTDMEDEDEIIELPKEKWAEMTVTNSEYDPTDPDDFESITFEEWMKTNKEPGIIAGTMYV